MKSKTISTFVFMIIWLCSYSQITPDSLKGTYVGQYWFKWDEDLTWAIKVDTAYVLSIDTSSCSIHNLYPAYLPSGVGDFETLYSFCKGNSSNWFSRFYSGDSLAIIYNDVSRPPPNYHLWSARFYGKKISSKILTNIDDNINSELSINAYPNPFDNYIKIENLNGKDCFLKLNDLSGKVIATKLIKNQNDFQFNTDQLVSGFYILQISTSQYTKLFKFYKK